MADPLPVTPPVLVFDGDCAFCSTSATFVVRRLRRSPADYAVQPWQRLDVAAFGLTPADCTESLRWVDAGGRTHAAQDAVARMLLASRAWARPVGALLLVPGIRQVAGVAYRWVARNRHRLPGGTPACAI
jgi:predicted DCC family thiol-disulfide oxidoreductase YuxK